MTERPATKHVIERLGLDPRVTVELEVTDSQHVYPRPRWNIPSGAVSFVMTFERDGICLEVAGVAPHEWHVTVWTAPEIDCSDWRTRKAQMLATDWWDYGYGEGYEHDDDVMAKEVEQFTQRLLAYDLRLVELPRRPRKWLKRLRGDPPIRYGLEWRVDADSDWVLAVPLNEASFPWNLPQPRDDSSGGN